ncbi:MAG: M48 family metallopeptidase [Rhodobacteraceae bacterium]|nr:M48 family metallopeptidase [Paracoccaceae bacterium]
MTEIWLPGEPPVAVLLRRSARARRLSLRVSRLDGRVTLTIPAGASEAEAAAFARSKADWVRAARARAAPVVPVGHGTVLPVAGRPLAVTPAPVRAARIEAAALLVPSDPARAGPRVAAFLKHVARAALAEAADRHSAALGRPHAGIVLRDTRSRWGSCTHEGRLMFSWRLAMAPPEVLDYVAAHEVAHLQEMNHSPAFWSVVARLLPDHARHRRWLRHEGDALMRYDFTGLR